MTTVKRAPRVIRAIYRGLRSVDALKVPLGLFDQAFRSSGFLRGSGWFESYRTHMPVAFGQPIPFYTYGSISFLTPRIDRSMSVFEYGSGNSTLWWAARAKGVTACEHDRGWYERMSAKAPSNVALVHHELGPAYHASAISKQSDVIVIDGRDRVSCSKACLPGLSERGVIVWDNSDRERYQEGFDFLKANGFRRVDFSGPGPIDFWPWMTSIFYRNKNCLEL